MVFINYLPKDFYRRKYEMVFSNETSSYLMEVYKSVDKYGVVTRIEFTVDKDTITLAIKKGNRKNSDLHLESYSVHTNLNNEYYL